MKFDVIFFDALALFECASCRADAEAQIPQSASEVSNQRTKGLLGTFVTEQEQDVEIGVGKEQAATVPTQGQQAQAIGGRIVDAQDLSKDLPDVGIGELAERGNRFPRAD